MNKSENVNVEKGGSEGVITCRALWVIVQTLPFALKSDKFILGLKGFSVAAMKKIYAESKDGRFSVRRLQEQSNMAWLINFMLFMFFIKRTDESWT